MVDKKDHCVVTRDPISKDFFEDFLRRCGTEVKTPQEECANNSVWIVLCFLHSTIFVASWPRDACGVADSDDAMCTK